MSWNKMQVASSIRDETPEKSRWIIGAYHWAYLHSNGEVIVKHMPCTVTLHDFTTMGGFVENVILPGCDLEYTLGMLDEARTTVNSSLYTHRNMERLRSISVETYEDDIHSRDEDLFILTYKGLRKADIVNKWYEEYLQQMPQLRSGV